MAWGIADTATQIEKIRAESSDYLDGLNSAGEIDYTTYSNLWDFYHDLIGEAYEQGLKDAPNDKRKDAEPVKHGHWTDNGHIGKRRWCSVCGGIAFEQYDDYGLAEVTESDYCPHCGAKMDEVEDGEI